MMLALPDPLLVWFLLSRRGHFSVDDLADRSAQMRVIRGGYSSSTIDRWFREPTRMDASRAAVLLALMDLKEEWAKFIAGDTLPPPVSGALDYEAGLAGRYAEADFVGCQERGLTPLSIAAQLVNIDSQLFTGSQSASWVGSVENWAGIITTYPDYFRCFLDRSHQIAAYWMFVCPKREHFEAGCLGDYPEHEITLSTLAPPDAATIDMFGPGMYVAADVSTNLKQVLGARLVMSFTYQCSRLVKSGRQIRRICVPVFSSDGRRLAERRFGLEPMPANINARYREQLGWHRAGADGAAFPELYFSWATHDVLRRTGIDSATDDASARIG